MDNKIVTWGEFLEALINARYLRTEIMNQPARVMVDGEEKNIDVLECEPDQEIPNLVAYIVEDFNKNRH